MNALPSPISHYELRESDLQTFEYLNDLDRRIFDQLVDEMVCEINEESKAQEIPQSVQPDDLLCLVGQSRATHEHDVDLLFSEMKLEDRDDCANSNHPQVQFVAIASTVSQSLSGSTDECKVSANTSSVMSKNLEELMGGMSLRSPADEPASYRLMAAQSSMTSNPFQEPQWQARCYTTSLAQPPKLFTVH